MVSRLRLWALSGTRAFGLLNRGPQPRLHAVCDQGRHFLRGSSGEAEAVARPSLSEQPRTEGVHHLDNPLLDVVRLHGATVDTRSDTGAVLLRPMWPEPLFTATRATRGGTVNLPYAHRA